MRVKVSKIEVSSFIFDIFVYFRRQPYTILLNRYFWKTKTKSNKHMTGVRNRAVIIIHPVGNTSAFTNKWSTSTQIHKKTTTEKKRKTTKTHNNIFASKKKYCRSFKHLFIVIYRFMVLGNKLIYLVIFFFFLILVPPFHSLHWSGRVALGTL